MTVPPTIHNEICSLPTFAKWLPGPLGPAELMTWFSVAVHATIVVQGALGMCTLNFNLKKVLL